MGQQEKLFIKTTSFFVFFSEHHQHGNPPTLGAETMPLCDFASLADFDDDCKDNDGRKKSNQNIYYAIFSDFLHLIKPPCKGRPSRLKGRAETRSGC